MSFDAEAEAKKIFKEMKADKKLPLIKFGQRFRLKYPDGTIHICKIDESEELVVCS